MFALAAAKARTGRALGNPVLVTEGRVTLVDGVLAVAVLAGLALNAAVGWWQADPLAALVIVAGKPKLIGAKRNTYRRPGGPAVRISCFLHKRALHDGFISAPYCFRDGQ